MTNNKPKFNLGRVVITSNANDNISMDDVNIAITRHHHGDWGILSDEDKQENEDALLNEGRLFSSYESVDRIRFFIITEADRNYTTILLPEDY